MLVYEIEKVLLEQQDELAALREEQMIHRPEEELINLNSKLAQVVIGVRRSGKSTLCYNALIKSNVNFAYVNFDDERFVKLSTEDLDDVLQSLYKIYGDFTHLFLDEIQNVDGWPLFVNRLLRQKLHMVITGSNAKLLSSELASHLTGRHHKIELYPFSFKDWCSLKKIDYTRLTTKNKGLISKAYEEYFRQGGFPELIQGEENPKEYISNLVESILTQDIKKRFNVRNTDALKRLANHLLNDAPAFIVKDSLKEIFSLSSDHTIANYISYLSQAYLISTINKYSSKSRERMRAEKYYAIDVAFMDKRENAFSGANLGWRMETLVYLELLRRKRSTTEDIYYFKSQAAEADFVVCDGNRALAIYQVSYDISSPKTRTREIRGCIAAAKTTSCDTLYLITDHEKDTIVENGYTIQLIPVWEWLVK